MSTVDLVMRIIIAGFIFLGVIQALAILLYLRKLCDKMFEFGIELLGTMKAQEGQPIAPDREEDVFTEEELSEDLPVPADVEFHGRHHCSEGKEEGE